MLEIGRCDYVAEITPLSITPAQVKAAPAAAVAPVTDKATQNRLLSEFVHQLRPVPHAWKAIGTAQDVAKQ